MNVHELPKKTQPEWMEETPYFETIVRGLDRCCAVSSGHVNRVIEETFPLIGAPNWKSPDLRLTSILHWATYSWIRSNRPIFRMSHSLASALVNTELPEETIDILPQMPFDALYIDTPDAFTVVNQQTGRHRGEGVLLFRDVVQVPGSRLGVAPAIGIVVIGEDKAKERGALIRDDAVQYCFVVGGKPIIGKDYTKFEGIVDGLKLGLNMLFLWNSDAKISTKEVQPVVPKSPAKQKKLNRRGRSTRKYFYIDFKEAWGATKKAPSEWTGPMHETVVCGHFRRYWVFAPGFGVQVLGTKTIENGKIMSCIRKFIAPHRAMRRGEMPEKNVWEVRRDVARAP